MIMCVWGHHAYKNNKYLDVLCTPSDDVCHKFYSNYYRSTINILRNALTIFTGHLYALYLSVMMYLSLDKR